MMVIKSIGKCRFFNIPYRTEIVTINAESSTVQFVKQIGVISEEMTIENSQITDCKNQLNLGIVDLIAAVIEFLLFLACLSSPTSAILMLLFALGLSVWSAISYQVNIYYEDDYVYEFIVPSKTDCEKICKLINDWRQGKMQNIPVNCIFEENSSIEILRYMSLAAFILLILFRIFLR